MKTIEGCLPCPEAKIAIVVSRFNSFITERLL
ncbi:MAG: 6,7-dimethyl-8-ribityllumazine synthase, partial [Succinivibrionaceae bacterium]|nr:6,7-dimethyl-8-ribityllumazine synthase [Succinivibrionaceae bacterium]